MSNLPSLIQDIENSLNEAEKAVKSFTFIQRIIQHKEFKNKLNIFRLAICTASAHAEHLHVSGKQEFVKKLIEAEKLYLKLGGK